MAYNGGYEPHGRPYDGPAASRPVPQRQYPPGPPGPPGPPRPGPYSAPPPQQYDQYADDYGYGYDEYATGYDEGYGTRYEGGNYPREAQNQSYSRQDYYEPGPGRGGVPMPPPGRGRGAPMPGPGAPGPGVGRGAYPARGNGPGPGAGRGYPPPGRGARPAPPNGGRPAANEQMSPTEPGFGGNPFPAFPGRPRKTDLDDEQQMVSMMGGMEITDQRRVPARQNTMEPPRDYGQPPSDRYGGRPMHEGRGQPRPYPPQGYPDQQRGPPAAGYGPPGDYQEDNFGPPERSMTAPVRNPPPAHRIPGPPRNHTTPYNGPAGRGMPLRPNTAQAMRPPPQRTYPPNGEAHGPAEPYQDSGYDEGQGGPYAGQQRPASLDDFYDYYDGRRSADYPPGNYAPAAVERPDLGSHAGSQASLPRDTFDQQVRPGVQGRPQRGPGRLPEVNRTKSQPDLRQPQAAIFEMAGDVPPIPSEYQQPGFQGGQFNSDSQGYDRPPSIGRAGLPNGPAPVRPGAKPPTRSSSESLPSHPAPIRPGLMPNSLVSLNNKPPPVRSYEPVGTPGVVPQAPPPPQANSSTSTPKQEEAPVTVDVLERLRAMVKANSNDQDSALLLAKKLIEASDVLIPNLPDPKARARSRERYLTDAHKLLKKLSNYNNADAMFFYADCLGRGLFTAEPDNKEAFLLYQSAAKLGHAAAAYRTAVCCEIGNEEGGGTRKDPMKAIQWYKRAATLGDTPAMYKMGMILLKGLLGQQKNPREAVGWLKRAAERADAENPHALHELGLLYESAQPNDAILRDEAYAFQLFKKAADLGYKFSQFRLGCAYEYGLMGCPIDPRLSIMWYSRAATQEEHQSELALSGWYLTGSEGVLQQSDTEAYLWARKAAMAGLAKAEYAMGYFTEVGIGVPANLEDAKRWYWRAAAQDFPKARERLEDLKRSGKSGPRQRERISRSKIGKQQEGECSVM
ncbi:hypothetical protein VTK73DRAFT_9354 [Phialemonium thermophilum]|uniref:Chitin synthase regulatory factor 3 n=1 Tax=Phialemonium thermophilum TaxID=223376 RepID=A0ABR3XKC8_9PEZI